MNANHPPGSAVSDADLIRYLDGELDLDESERIEAAIAGDDTVAGRLAVLSRRGRNLSAMLGSVDPSDEETRSADPSRRTSAHGTTGTRWLKAAIIVFALLGAGMLVPPVRAWIVDRLETIVSGEDSEAAVSPETPAVEEGAAVSFGIPVAGAVLEVTLDEPQSGGELIVESADISNARIEPLDAAVGDPVVVTPDAVRIDNGAASTGGYRLIVPRSVTSVRVRFGAGESRSWEVGVVPITIPLTGGDA